MENSRAYFNIKEENLSDAEVFEEPDSKYAITSPPEDSTIKLEHSDDGVNVQLFKSTADDFSPIKEEILSDTEVCEEPDSKYSITSPPEDSTIKLEPSDDAVNVQLLKSTADDFSPIKEEILSDTEVFEEPDCKLTNLVCDHCSGIFPNEEIFKTHIRRCIQSTVKKGQTSNSPPDSKSPFQCDICGNVLSSQQCLNRHRKIHADVKLCNAKLICNACGKSYSNRSTLVKHYRKHHPGEKPCHQLPHNGGNLKKKDKKPFRCNECGKIFPSNSSLIVHIRVHSGEKPYKCQECDKEYSRKSHFNEHQRVHSGEKPFSCAECYKKFAVKKVYNDHLLIHSGEKPYQCQKCLKRFTHRSNVGRHQRAHTCEKVLCCEKCGKVFKHNSNFVKHERRYCKGQLYQCQECDRSFYSELLFVKHQRKHSDERTHSCQECGKSFAIKTNLTKHLRVHSGDNRFKCDECGMGFVKKRTLIRHLRIHSKEKPYGFQKIVVFPTSGVS